MTSYLPAIGGAQINTHQIAHLLSKINNIQVATLWTENRYDWLFGTTLNAPKIGLEYSLDGVKINQITLSDLERKNLRLYVYGYYLFKRKAIQKISEVFEPKLELLAKGVELIHNIRIGREPLSCASFNLARRLRVPFIITPNHHPRWVGFNYKEFIRIYNLADGIIALTNSEKSMLTSLGVDHRKIFVTGIAPIISETHDPNSFRESYGINSEPIILFLGQKFNYKGCQLILRAAPIVWNKFPKVKFVFMGPRTNYSIKLFSSINDKRVLELGGVDLQEKTNALAACDLLCVPSSQESFGGVYTEAWAMKKPVIGLDIPAVREVVADGMDGFVVNDDPKKIAQKIILFLESPALKRQLGEKGYEKVKNKYSWDLISAKMATIYEDVLNNYKGLNS